MLQGVFEGVVKHLVAPVEAGVCDYRGTLGKYHAEIGLVAVLTVFKALFHCLHIFSVHLETAALLLCLGTEHVLDLNKGRFRISLSLGEEFIDLHTAFCILSRVEIQDHACLFLCDLRGIILEFRVVGFESLDLHITAVCNLVSSVILVFQEHGGICRVRVTV